MRRIFALLAVASLSGCITDGPNKTGSEWLNSLDLGPNGYQTVKLPLGVAQLDTIVEPGVPAYSGIGSLVVGQSEGFDAVASLWFDAKDSTRWKQSGKLNSSVGKGWTLRLMLDTTCPTGRVNLSRWNSPLDTTVFLLGDTVSRSPDYQVWGTCSEDPRYKTRHYLDFALGDSTAVVRKGDNFGVRLDGDGFDARKVARVAILSERGDSLFYGLLEGRGAWGTRLRQTKAVGISGMSIAGTRLRMRLDYGKLRDQILAGVGIDPVRSDSFDNSVSVFSARVSSRVTGVTSTTTQRLRMASWSVIERDTTELAFENGSRASASFASSRARDGKSMAGDLRLVGLANGIVRVALVSDGDSVPFYTREGTVVYHFHLFPGESVEAPMYADPGWSKFQFANDGKRVRFVRTVLSEGVAADDQIQEVDANGNFVYREEAIASQGVDRIRFEARTAFGRMLNNLEQEIWTDLYSATISDASLEGNFRVDLADKPVDSVTVIVRRRSQGVVE